MAQKRSIRTENPKLYQQIRGEVTDFILQGYSSSEVAEYLKLNYNIEEVSAKQLYSKVGLEIIELGEFDHQVVVMQHLHYYEEAIRYFDSIGNYSAKALAMNAKEKLLKIFEDDEPQIEIENNVNISTDQLDFDISKLSNQEQVKFNDIFQKVKFSKGS